MAYGEQLGIEYWRNKLFWWVIRLQVMMRIRRLARLYVGDLQVLAVQIDGC